MTQLHSPYLRSYQQCRCHYVEMVKKEKEEKKEKEVIEMILVILEDLIYFTNDFQTIYAIYRLI